MILILRTTLELWKKVHWKVSKNWVQFYSMTKVKIAKLRLHFAHLKMHHIHTQHNMWLHITTRGGVAAYRKSCSGIFMSNLQKKISKWYLKWGWWCDPSENESFARETMTCKVAWSKDCKKMRKQYKKGHDLRMPKLWVFKLHSLHTHTRCWDEKSW